MSDERMDRIMYRGADGSRMSTKIMAFARMDTSVGSIYYHSNATSEPRYSTELLYTLLDIKKIPGWALVNFRATTEFVAAHFVENNGLPMSVSQS